MHALIIEDQFLIAALIEDMLSALGYTSFDAVDGEAAAVRAAALRRPDLIAVDHRISEGSGVGAVRAIRAAGDVPTVFITEYGEEVRALLPDAVLVEKPFNDKMLRAAVAQARELAAAATGD